MSFLRAIAAILIVASPVFARARASSYCTQGGQVAITNTIPSATKIQQSYPQCSIQVFYSGGAQGYVTTSGTTVTFSSGIPFNANSGWPGLNITINSVPYTISSVTSPFVLVLTASAGTQATPVAYSMPATAPAAIYSNNTGTALANPFVSSTTGYWGFFADNGTYDISASGGGIPAPITWSAVSVIDPLSLPPFISSRTYIKQGLTFYQACASAAAQGLTLVIDQTWYAIPTSGTCAATVQGGGGLIQPASGQTVTVTVGSAGLTQICDASLGGNCLITGPTGEVYPEWWGFNQAVTDGHVAFTAATSALNALGGGTLHFSAGTYLGYTNTWAGNTWLRGSSVGATTLKLPNGANADILQGLNFTALDNTPQQIPETRGSNFTQLTDITLDGNKANNSSGYCARVWGMGMYWTNVVPERRLGRARYRIRNAAVQRAALCSCISPLPAAQSAFSRQPHHGQEAFTEASEFGPLLL